MYLARHDPNLCELDLCGLNRPMPTCTEVIPASQDLVELVMPDTLTLPLKLLGLSLRVRCTLLLQRFPFRYRSVLVERPLVVV